ncbi:MAG TPA: FAD-dependent oxidoreductase, partial [Phenylobacterium sp.]|uniref:NAD(P)/FAD-dependent oxidoreductase n=1 Tax=Phenylobacterium sp. TaxID=1871053 RepID=UPI002F944A1F
VIVEREDLAGYHTTGRSAAMYIPSYGSPATAPLTRASRAFFEAPPAGFDGSLLRPRPVLHLAREGQMQALEKLCRRAKGMGVTAAMAHQLVPILRPGIAAGGLLEADAADIDVARLHGGWLRQAKELGAELRLGAGDYRIERRNGLWWLQGEAWTLRAPVIVNAAGAWADVVAAAAGLRPFGLEPRQRTVVLVDPPEHPDFGDWPIVKDVEERFYFRPLSQHLLITPADEAPSPPCDARPDPLDIACAMMRFDAVADHPVRTIRHKWAGLRTFAPDRAPLVGWSPEVPGFFWHAALGGIGIQTSPAASRLAAAMLLDEQTPTELIDAGLQAETLSPERLANAA